MKASLKLGLATVILGVAITFFNLGRWIGLQQSESVMREMQNLVAADADLKAADARLRDSCSKVDAVNERLRDLVRLDTAQLRKDGRAMRLCVSTWEKEVTVQP